VIPSKREEYLEAAEKYFTQLMSRGIEDLGGVKLTASWETIVGSVGEFTHVLEYEGFKGFDETSRALRKDSVSFRYLVLTDVIGNEETQLGHSAKHHFSTTSDHIRILILAIISSKGLWISGWWYL
jgi:hypothetical protein